jgi:ribosomal protein S18 acetylase RimI-like enzyme
VAADPLVRRASRADARLVVRTLANAFDDDPVMTWLLPRGITLRHQRLRAFFSCEVHSYFHRDKPVYIAGDGQSAALWSPPGTWTLTPTESLTELLPMTAIFASRIVRASRLATELDALHPKTERHWYLYLLGTRSDSQGRGIGAAMLREALTVVDAAGEPAYLESSNHRNVALYQRHGFNVVNQIRISRGGPPMWLMWRDAAR